jgi:ubiquinone/menaquinone biosynthesis C-methylase UbiE
MTITKRLFSLLPGAQLSGALQPAAWALEGAQRVVWRTLDLLDASLGRRDALTPPRRLMYVGTEHFFTRSDFNSIGEKLLHHLVDIGGLKPSDNVLDVGCGVGRMAAQLTRYLSPQSTYHGFDIVSEGIEWCVENISPRFPNFHFHHSDIYNSRYNPCGKVQSSEYRFPFRDGQFSFVFLTSVFTHMLSPEVRNYLSEIQRVLAPNGRCLITYFLLNSDSQLLLDTGKSTLDFRFPIFDGKVVNESIPEVAVAFDETYIRDLYRICRLSVVDPIHFGSWCGRPTNVGYQDVVIGVKR